MKPIKTNKKNSLVFKKYETIRSFVHYLSDGKSSSWFDGHESSFSGSADFCGTESFDEAQRIMECGDWEIYNKLEKYGVAKTRMKLQSTAPQRKLTPSVCGVLPHIPNYIAGIPLNMIDVRQEQVKTPVLNVYYNCSAAGGVSCESLIKSSAKIISALMRIEAGGTKINLFLCEISEARDAQKACTLIKIKDAQQPFNTLKMSYPLCNPSMLRRHMFRWTEVTPELTSAWSGGYGRSITRVQDGIDILNKCGQKVDAYLNYYSCNNKTTDEIIKFIEGGCKE